MSPTSQERRAQLAHPLGRYARMVEIRRFEERVNELFASGAIHGTTHLCNGQEALAVGLAAVLRTSDAVTATYRGHGVALALGMTPESVLGEIMGKAGGCTGGVGGSMHLCDMSLGLLPTFAIVGAGIPVAAGAALAFQTRGEDNVGVAVFGDGATNIGAFHEALNLAAIWQLPAVFVVDNNVYGEYSRIDRTTPLEDLHLRASSYGMTSAGVDGMDVDAVMKTVGEAVALARSGDGPCLVEAKTYRFAGHSRADTATYRPAGELEHWLERDPLVASRDKLVLAGHDSAALDAVEREVHQRLTEVVGEVSDWDPPSTGAMFEHITADPEVPTT